MKLWVRNILRATSDSLYSQRYLYLKLIWSNVHSSYSWCWPDLYYDSEKKRAILHFFALFPVFSRECSFNESYGFQKTVLKTLGKRYGFQKTVLKTLGKRYGFRRVFVFTQVFKNGNKTLWTPFAEGLQRWSCKASRVVPFSRSFVWWPGPVLGLQAGAPGGVLDIDIFHFSILCTTWVRYL